MVTGKDDTRHEYAKLSIENFWQQTHPNKYLLIINHGKALIMNNHHNILEISVNKKYFSLGALRNIALQIIPPGACWTTWDDDDYRHPEYLTSLYKTMIQSNADIVCITNRMEYNSKTRLIWRMRMPNGMQFALVRHNHATTFSYLDQDTMEDVHLSTHFKRRFMFDNDPLLYIRIVHGSNTSLYVDPEKSNVYESRNPQSRYQEYKASTIEEKQVLNIISHHFRNVLSTNVGK